ncbi:MAG: diacylglycerol/polyprenol kinase family protein [bacterium]
MIPDLPQAESQHLHARATINFQSELIRKSIHLCSLSVPIIYSQISKELALMLLIPMFIGFLGVDLARYYHEPTRLWFQRWFGRLLRKSEKDGKRKQLTGATFVLISAVVCVLIFPKIITITAFAVMIISDITSALVGRKFGKHKFFDKSLEGSTGFLVSGVLVILVTPKIQGLPLEYIIAFVGVVIGTVVEACSIKIDDNLSIPISIGLIMWGLYLLLLPAVNLYSIL